MSYRTEQRPDGLYILFPMGEEAGPFGNEGEAEEFLRYVETQRGN